MSIFSDYEHGYMNDREFRQACARMNREERWDYEHEFDEDECDEDEDEEDY